MKALGQLRQIALREVWPNEAQDFTPWMAENLDALGEVLGVDLELARKEAAVGDFSLDLLATNLATQQHVVIENQLTSTDHDHLGKLLTYASGYDAEIVVWVAQSIREEHRQALDWLNQRSDAGTNFFAVVVELLQVDESLPAYNFKLVVAPNEWQKQQRASSGGNSPRAEAYRKFFQKLIDDLRDRHKFTNARVGQPQNWYAFSSGMSPFAYSASFGHGSKVRVELYIDQGDADENDRLFDSIQADKDSIESEFGETLEWERLENKRACRIAVYRQGQILMDPAELDTIHSWLVDRLLRFEKVFKPRLKKILES